MNPEPTILWADVSFPDENLDQFRRHKSPVSFGDNTHTNTHTRMATPRKTWDKVSTNSAT